MEKVDFMAVGSIVKLIFGLVGIALTLYWLTVGLIRKDNRKLKRAGMTFAAIWLALVVLTAIEFLILISVY